MKALALLTLTLALTAHSQCPKGYNCDESGVQPYTLLDPLTTTVGAHITKPTQWPARRAEILHLFEQNVFGRTPEAAKHLPLRSHIDEPDTPALNTKATRRQITLYFTDKLEAGPKEHILLYLPANIPGKIPIVLGINFTGNQEVVNDPGILLNPTWSRPPGSKDLPTLAPPAASTRGHRSEAWQVEKLIAHGYGFATIYYGDIEPDYKDSWQLGLRPTFFTPGQTQPASDDWGALAAWAWSLSRALDYLATDPRIDAHRVAITGHSRLGKAVDWAFAQDTRFAALLSTESGKGGQSLTRRTSGENVAHLQHSFPYWFCANYAQWVDHDREIPADGNLLLALAAPRPIYVASAEQDLWSDPRGEFLSALDVYRVYKLLGKSGLSTTTMPTPNQPTDPTRFVAYHVRTGKHDVTAYDWDQYLNFLDAHFPQKP